MFFIARVSYQCVAQVHAYQQRSQQIRLVKRTWGAAVFCGTFSHISVSESSHPCMRNAPAYIRNRQLYPQTRPWSCLLNTDLYIRM